MIYKGGCHCGNISFDVVGEITMAVSCNCSICSRKGSLMWAVPRGDLHLHTSEQDMGTYTFNNHVIQHHFCATCGMHPFGESSGPDGGTAFVNLRCLEIADLSAIPVFDFDGRSA